MFVADIEKKSLHECLRKMTTTLSKNVGLAKNDEVQLLKELRENSNISIFTDDKDSSVVIMSKADYQSVVQKLINEGIERGK